MQDQGEPDQAASLKADMAADYVRAIESWMRPLEGRFYSMTYLLMFMKLLSTRGIKRGELALFLEITSKISRSTAERAITEANKAGHIEIKAASDRRGLELFLSADLEKHFTAIFVQALERSKWRLDRRDTGH